MKKLVLIGIALLTVLMLVGMAGCGGSLPESTPTPEPAPEDDLLEVTGTVIFLDIEGGFWGIRGDDGKNYQPINLAPELKKENLRADFQLKLLKDRVSIHMWGILVEILRATQIS